MPREVKPLKWLIVDLLAAHVDELVELAGESLRALPPDVRHALLAVARRKGILDDAALTALVDDSWIALDVSGCGDSVTDAGIRALAARNALRSVVAVDVTGCTGITADGIRGIVLAAPRLSVLRCGGDPRCNASCRDAIAPATPGGGVLPRLLCSNARPSLESWEALGDDENLELNGECLDDEKNNNKTPKARFGEGARLLRWLMWPDIDRTSRGRVRTRSPGINVIAPPAEVVAAASEAAEDVHFVAVKGEGWIGFGNSRDGAYESVSRVTPAQKPGPIGRSANNDGLVLVAAGHTGALEARKNEGHSPWWFDKRSGDDSTFRPPPEADPTTALDLYALRFVRRDVVPGATYEDSITDSSDTRSASRGSPTESTAAVNVSRDKWRSASVEARQLGSSKLYLENSGLEKSALRWRLKFAEDAEGTESVASKFARACLEVETERRKKVDKNWKKQRNRDRNKLGNAERMIWNAMDDD